MALRLLSGGREDVPDAFDPLPPFDLRTQPLRPGLAHEHLELALDAHEVAAIKVAASVDAVPVGLWAAISIESERALRVSADAIGVESSVLEVALNKASSAKPLLALVRQHGRRLAAYAGALRSQRLEAHGDPDRCLAVPVAYHTLSAWELEAARVGATLEQWAATLLMDAPSGRPKWEAAAAERGQTLGEWVAVEAARRFSNC